MTPDRSSRTRAGGLRAAGAMGIAVVAVLRCVTFFAPQLVFDVDPAFDPDPLGGLGPAGSLWLDAVLLVACGVALLGEALGPRRLHAGLLALAALPWPVVLWHGLNDAGDLWRGATWATAAVAAVTVLHLARDCALRSLLVVLLAAVVGPLLVRGAANVTYEYDDNIALFETQREAILRDKGWDEDSPYALIFERRVRQRQPTGWFVTTNIYAALVGFGLVLAAGLALASARARLASGWTGACVLAAAAAAAGVWMSGSKGAVLAALLGMGLLVVGSRTGPAGRLVRRHAPTLLPACVVAALLAVIVRGVVLPEGFAGDRSLLFRWHYMVSSAGILAGDGVLGVGPDGYQAAYVAHRVPRNPEEVASAHSMFWDWTCAFGVLAAAWITLVFALLVRAGVVLRDTDGNDAGPAPDGTPLTAPAALAGTLAVVGLGLVPAVLVEVGSLHELSIVVRLLGIAGYVAAAALAGHVAAHGDRRAVTVALAAGVTLLAVHGQIEMTFTQPGTAVWLMAVLGLAAARVDTATPGPSPSRVRAGGVLAAGLGTLAFAIVVVGAVPAGRQERLMLDAAGTLRPLADPARPATPAEEIALRRRAAELLLAAHEAMPSALGPRVLAAQQLERAGLLAGGAEAVTLLEAALGHAEACIEDGDRRGAATLAIFVRGRLGELTGEPTHVETAITLQRAVVAADPNGLLARRRLGDLLWAAGRTDEARRVYARVLEIDDDFALDELKQLAPPERAVVEQRAGDR